VCIVSFTMNELMCYACRMCVFEMCALFCFCFFDSGFLLQEKQLLKDMECMIVNM